MREWIVLDTGVVAGAAQRDEALGIDLARLAELCGEHPVSLSETAFLEVFGQLRRGRLSFEEWSVVADELDRLLDHDFPVLPGGAQLRALLGVVSLAGGLDDVVADQRRLWQLLRTATKVSDLDEERRVVLDGQRVNYRPTAIAEIVHDRERVWAEAFAKVTEEPAASASGDELAEQLNQLFQEHGSREVPELSTAAGFATNLIRSHQPSKRGDRYRPTVNDAMDFGLLFTLGLPAIVCTSDHKLCRRVRALRTPGSDRVLTPVELLGRLVDERRRVSTSGE